jgi:hypothetical protein
MQKAILVADFGLAEVVVAEFNCVGDDEGFSCGVDNLEAAVVE